MVFFLRTHSKFALALSLVLLSGCSNKPAAAPAPAAVPVRVATVAQKTVPVEVPAIGTVEAIATVSMKAQVAGQLESVLFREGQEVRKGDVLFRIDARPFQVALQQAEANLARDSARLDNARTQAQRYARLFEEGVAAREQADQTRADAESLEATVKADQAAVEKARLDLAYCTIVAPIGGRTGSLIVKEGNLVKANDDPALVVINQISPIYVAFGVPEQNLGEIKRFAAAGKLPVAAVLPDGGDRPEQGTLAFVDNTVDTATGTIRLKGIFENRGRRLWPGQFVNVVLTLSAQPNATVVPAAAVQTGQSGPYVYVVRSDGTAEARPVAPGRTVQGETVVDKGLTPGEVVVTEGQLRLVPGAKVQVKE